MIKNQNQENLLELSIIRNVYAWGTLNAIILIEELNIEKLTAYFLNYYYTEQEYTLKQKWSNFWSPDSLYLST